MTGEVIGKVVLRDRDGQVVREYVTDEVTSEQSSNGELRRMDCMDCHNRPTHPFSATAERAVDQAIASEAIPRGLPYVRREAVAVLRTEYPSQAAAAKAIGEKLAVFYRTQYPDVYHARRQDVDQAIAATQRVYRRNVFPDMKVTGSYPNNIDTDFLAAGATTTSTRLGRPDDPRTANSATRLNSAGRRLYWTFSSTRSVE
jgi:hypothetical protein